MEKHKIKILGQIFEIEETEFEDEGNGITFGETNFLNNKIKINKKIKEERKEITLIHEILHCIFTSLRFDSENENETLISSLAESFYLFLKENNSISFLKI